MYSFFLFDIVRFFILSRSVTISYCRPMTCIMAISAMT